MIQTTSDLVTEVINKVRQTIKKHDMIHAGDLVICAVSGGPDSMCLLDSLLCLSRELDFTIHVGHLHHHMRGEQADKDAEIVADFCRSRNVPVTIGHAQVFDLAQELGVGVEEAGRIARYQFLFDLSQEVGGSKIAVGHNMNDQAETVIMRLVRGAGTQGLAGIPPVKGEIIRPIIYIPRDEIEEYCRIKGLPVITDIYNFDLAYTRNLVRHKIIPEMKELFNPSIVEVLSQTAEVLRWDAEYLEHVADCAFKRISFKEGRMTFVDEGDLAKLPKAISSRVLESAWRECAEQTENLHIRHVIRLLDENESTLTLPGGVIAHKHDGYIGFYPPPPEDLDVPIQVPGITVIPELGISVKTRVFDKPDGFIQEDGRIADHAVEGANSFNSAFTVELKALADYNICGDVIRVRTRKPGDRFKPLGMDGKEKKLQDFLVSAGISRYYRNFIPIFVSGEKIVWVGGFRLDEEFKVTEDTLKILEITIEPLLRQRQNCANI